MTDAQLPIAKRRHHRSLAIGHWSFAEGLVVALARQLAIDLWRWRTGRCTMADLGWIPA
jgi:hypothetical protein